MVSLAAPEHRGNVPYLTKVDDHRTVGPEERRIRQPRARSARPYSTWSVAPSVCFLTISSSTRKKRVFGGNQYVLARARATTCSSGCEASLTICRRLACSCAAMETVVGSIGNPGTSSAAANAIVKLMAIAAEAAITAPPWLTRRVEASCLIRTQNVGVANVRVHAHDRCERVQGPLRETSQHDHVHGEAAPRPQGAYEG